MKPISSKLFWQTYFGFGIFIGLIALYQTLVRVAAMDVSLWHSKWTFLLLGYILTILGSAFLFYSLQTGRIENFFERLENIRSNATWRWFVSLPIIAVAFVPPVVKLYIFGRTLPGFFPLLWVFWWICLFQVLAWKWATSSSWAASFASVVLIQVVAYQVYENLLVVTMDPFSIDYSETSRFYYGSLWLSQSLYGMRMPLSPWHATRYILMAIPFLIRGLPLWAHRIWQVLLWLGVTSLSSWLLVRRLHLSNKALALLVACWSFVYLLQGPVYYYLQVCVIIILLSVEMKHPWRSLIAVSAASFWAGMSGVNWYPVPAALAAALYLLEQPVSESKNVWGYLIKPLLWGVLGLVSAFAGQAFYIFISGNKDTSLFRSSLTSSLLWNRLLPSPAFPLGILPGIILISLPLWLGLWFALRGRLNHLHPIRVISLGLILLVLFIGCLVVSVKIGGGADLHDLDSYEVLLQIIAVYFFANQVRPESGNAEWGMIPWPVLVLVILIPFVFPLDYVGSWVTYNSSRAQVDIKKLQAAVAPAAAQGGEVLFISERQLITFNYIQGVPLVPEDEIVELMEIAMSNNRPALSKFYADLHQHRFALIVSRKLNTGIKTGEAFSEENNAWSQDIAAPILCEYQPVLSLQSNNLQVYAPKSSGTESCP
jgi:hypothetical protein